MSDRPELAAFAGSSALPLALLRARLLGALDVVDLSADPSPVPGPLAELCPAVRLLPRDAPACDRIVRAGGPVDDVLLAEAARRLRPGGLLVAVGSGEPEGLEARAARHGLAASVEPGPDGLHVVAAARGPAPRIARRVALLLLSWNIRDVLLESLEAAVREAALLRRAGHEALVVVWDNGSTDGTAEALRRLDGSLGVPHRLLLSPENVGHCRGRNAMIETALELGADHLLLVDGDIEVVPGSTHAMLQALEAVGPRLGTVWPDPESFATARGRETPWLWGLGGRELELVPHRVFTGYGLFRREVFDRGVRFDEDAVFRGAGHGFEDVDFAFQVQEAGFESRRFGGLRFLHRYPNSSIDVMRRLGVDGRRIAADRKAYVLAKWAGRAGVEGGPLDRVRGIPVP